MGRAPCCDKSKVKKGPWTPDEDFKLISFIQNHGHPNWRNLPKLAGLMRCGKSCRLRWINYLRPEVKRGNWTRKEEEKLISLHQSLGSKWSKIALNFPGRTDNEIKNVWNTHLKKKLLQSKDFDGDNDILINTNDNDENNIHKNISGSSECRDSPYSPYSSATSISSCISYGDIFNLHDDQDLPKQVHVSPQCHPIYDLQNNQNETCNTNSTCHHQKENDLSDVNNFWNTILFTTVINDKDDCDNILTQPNWQLAMNSQTPTGTQCFESEVGGGADDSYQEEWMRYLEHELGLVGDDVSHAPLFITTTSSFYEENDQNTDDSVSI